MEANNSHSQQLDLRLTNSENNLRKYTDQLDKERKLVKDVEEGKMGIPWALPIINLKVELQIRI
jgi:hypothetical protein